MSQKKRRETDPPNGEEAEVPAPEDEIQVPIEVVDSSEADAGAETEEVELSPLEQAEARVLELEDRIRRLQAEFVNDTKRMKRQAEEDRKYAIDRVVLDLLTVFDALHVARQGLAHAKDGAASADAMTEGLDLLERELLNVLGRHGVEKMDAQGAAFDPTFHEALFVVEDPELEANTVAQVMRPGFTLHGRVVRPAHVAVTKGGDAAEDADGAAQDEGSPGDGAAPAGE